ncbi:MAG: UvrD-helicase domain-containing protein [Ruminococcus sp.]|nr:UvrD-helicase domain-containing protein [Ruminococcus sp.]
MSADFNTLKRQALDRCFSHLNEPQRKAVFKTTGPLLILAGAGSGKTTVLINRIAYMIRYGSAYTFDTPAYYNYSDDEISYLRYFAEGRETDQDKLAGIISENPVKPWSVLAITFTNKAAKELKDRLSAMLSETGEDVTASTFHSLCARILRREYSYIGFENNFTIYDADDSQRVCKAVTKELNISEKLFPPKTVLSHISDQKDKMISPKEMLNNSGDYQMRTIAQIYAAYQKRLFESNAMDFDDLLYFTVKLFEENPEVLDHYQNRYKYIMVDEYQDTNMVQFKLVALLARKFGNLCVVGDDDQSIYSFRGATIENILSFEDIFGCDPETDIIRLEQNYRSTQNILTCANYLIKNNTERKGKNLWTDAGDGNKVIVYKAADEKREASYISDTVLDNAGRGGKFNDNAVLYRTNAQSREIELALSRSGIPYRVYGGLKFFDRKEIKDIIAYLQVINNENDMLRLRRIINEPKRGIGDATVGLVEQIASDLGISPIEVMMQSEGLAPISRRSAKLRSSAELFRYFQDIAENVTLAELLDEILTKSGYKDMLKEDGIEGESRLENIEELKTSMADYEANAETPTLSGYLEEVALYTDIDRYDQNDDFVTLMTVHSAKGLEFNSVFVSGMEENLFPSSRSLETSNGVEEERRLAYVAVTRAKKQLYLLHAENRRIYGGLSYNKASRFIRELPKDNIESLSDPMLQGRSFTGMGSKPMQGITLEKQLMQKKQTKTSSDEVPVFSVGDRVNHRVFGEGTVLGVTNMANDALLEIAFDSKGTKRVMAKYAKIQKL